ncbi:MAG: substrate-binding domain-containing protein [Clostridiales bacterium]|nr:substrate-binding domain-containing protein [Clostridiales bacterium]
MSLKKPKYRQLADDLREAIRHNCKAGEKLETENEMIERYGVSRQTVRQALSILENEGLIVRRQGSGIYVSGPDARGQIQKPREKVITFVSTYISEYVFPSIIRGAEEVLRKAGYTLNLSQTENRVELERRIISSIIADPPAGMIVEGTKTAIPNPNVPLYRQLIGSGVPIVFINGYYANLDNTIYVVTDDRQGGRDAVSFLIKKGHKHIGGIFKSDDIQGHERYAGFAECLVENDAELVDERVLWFTTENRDQVLFGDNGRFLVNKFADCSAVVCYNDQIAVRVIDIFVRAGLEVPREKAVISFDNSHYSDLSSIRITSLDHPKENLGRAAAVKLLMMIGGKKEKPLVMPWGLSEKEST